MSAQPIPVQPGIAYSIFMSHSAADRRWVEWIAAHAKQIGMAVYLFEHDPQPGTYISEKVKQQIAGCDAVVVLLTSNSAQSAYVQQEIGFAEAHQKLIVPLVQHGLDQRCLAMLTGREYIPFDFRNPNAGLQPLLSSLLQRSALKAQQQVTRNLGLLAFGGLLLLALASRE